MWFIFHFINRKTAKPNPFIKQNGRKYTQKQYHRFEPIVLGIYFAKSQEQTQTFDLPPKHN